MIDLTVPDLKFEDDEDIHITIATETYWYNHFWQLSISVLVPLYTILFTGFSVMAYYEFKGYENREMGVFCGFPDKNWIWFEYWNHFKDGCYFYLRDHTWRFSLLFSSTMVLPLIISYGQAGDILRYAYFGMKMDDPKYAHARWMIKTNICFWENIPQTYLVLFETFNMKESITII